VLRCAPTRVRLYFEGRFTMPEMPTLWVPYVWVLSAIFLLIGVVIAVIWGFRTGQFKENIKYQMFEELDDDMYLDEDEQNLAMRQKKMVRETRLAEEAKEAAEADGDAPKGPNGGSTSA